MEGTTTATTTTIIQTTSASAAVHLVLTVSGASVNVTEDLKNALEDVNATGQIWLHAGQTLTGTDPARTRLSVKGWT